MSATEGNRYIAIADEITSILDKLTGYSNAKESCPLGRFIQIARKTARCIDPFVNINAVINYGLWYHFGRISNEEKPAFCPPELCQRYLDVFAAMTILNGDFLELLSELQRRPDKYFSEFMKNFARHYGKARSEDTSGVQSKVIVYVQMAGYGQLSTSDRKQLGWNNDVSARMLCPRTRLEEFDQNPDDFINRMKNGIEILDTFDWATFLYNETLPYDPDAQDKGLFQGAFLMKVYLHLFCGPGVAANGLNAPITKNSKGDKIGLISATPMTIAYAISQSYYVLTSSGHWNHTCLHVDLSNLFSGVIDLFREDEEWSNETIAWWNKQLRFKAKTVSPDDSIAANSSNSNLNNIRAQRARRRSTVNTEPPCASAENPSVSPTVEECPPSPPANNHPNPSVSPAVEEHPPSPMLNDISREPSPLSELGPEITERPLSMSNTCAANANMAQPASIMAVPHPESSAMTKQKGRGGRKRKVTNPEGQNMPPPLAVGSDARRSKRQRKSA